MKKYFILLVFISLHFGVFSAVKLSPQAQISLITCDPGEELYAGFGHSALRVSDPEWRIDLVYNYGTFDFEAPNFYLKFVRGFLDYMLSRHTFADFYGAYSYEDRNIVEQRLALTADEKQQIFDFLEWNYQPENKTYRYDFFFDNCATRIRDILENSMGEKLKFKNEYIENQPSFRSLIGIYLEERPWWEAPINLILGSVIDRKATPSEYMFLPDFLKVAFSNATVERNGQLSSLVETETILYRGGLSKKSEAKFSLPSPTLLLWIIFAIALVFTFVTKLKRKVWFFDYILLIFSGLLGLLIFLLWFGTEHHTTHQNLNIIWMSPLHLASFFILMKRKKIRWAKVYFAAFAAVNILFLLSLPILPQSIHFSFIPFILLLSLRFLNVRFG